MSLILNCRSSPAASRLFIEDIRHRSAGGPQHGTGCRGYKVEASRIGYDTETQTVEIKGSSSKKLAFTLKKIEEGERKTIEGASSDADKIVNPGEVNIQPPGM
jgi:hypothetical protein